MCSLFFYEIQKKLDFIVTYIIFITLKTYNSFYQKTFIIQLNNRKKSAAFVKATIVNKQILVTTKQVSIN